MKPVEEVIDELQCRALAYEVIFQSLCSQLPQGFINKAADNIEQRFQAKLEAAKAVASRILGTKI